MARLSHLSSRVNYACDRRAFASDASRGPAPAQHSQPWKAWYKTKRWRDLKAEVHIRDNYTCQRTGQLCGGTYPAPDSPVANHKRPHRGDPALFWDPANVETVSKAVHDSAIQAEEQSSLHQRGDWS
jgi:5-methylcytosine-specific restriction endonuclease McrA